MSSRSIANMSAFEWERLMERFAAALEEFDVSGSLAGQYSLYSALDREYEKALASKSAWVAISTGRERINPKDLE